MNKEAIAFIQDIVSIAPKHDKDALVNYIVDKYNLTKDRKVYYSPYYAVRVNYSKSGFFSNTVLSLSMLQKYDKAPFFVILVRGNNDNIVYLANTTFLSKISHSSKELTINNIKGSFNGSDIMKSYNGMDNCPDNFDRLFAFHQGLEWTDNLERLVDASSNIKPTSRKFEPSDVQVEAIYNSIDLADKFVKCENLVVLEDDLNCRCNKCKEAILAASHIENVNIRGRLIEYLITTDDETREKICQSIMDVEKNLPLIETHDELGDYVRVFDESNTLTDIKTKVIYLDSAPKAYNIDKFLSKMSEGNAIFLFFFIGIDKTGIMNTVLCSVYHKELIDASVVQHHWAGRATRGVVQFSGKHINNILANKDFVNDIDTDYAKTYLRGLLAR